MPITTQELLESARTLPPSERLRLAALILQELMQSGIRIVEESDEWSEQDQNDLVFFSLQYAAQYYSEDDELIEMIR